MTTATILVIDDEDKLRALLARILELEGYHIIQATNGQEALKAAAKHQPELVITDVKLPDTSGIALVEQLKAQLPQSEIIVLTAYGNIADGVQAIKNGAFDYIIKGDENDRIIPILARALEKIQLSRQVQQLTHALEQTKGFGQIIGEAKVLQTAMEQARKVAASDATVLLEGETGSGKELFAQAIHYHSARKQKPYLAVNCSAIGRELLESELFGYKAGAFTGAANKDKKGLLEEAHKGTLFLDEIGEMHIDLQAKLLRVLETGEFFKVGDTRPTHVDVRFIAATNRNLEKEADEGRFRLDLFYRLSVFRIHIPSLNERKSDIPLLAAYFLKIAAARMKKRTMDLSPEFLEALQNHHWKGNIRELKNIIERTVIMSDNPMLQPSDLPLDFTLPLANSRNAFDLEQVEKQHILRILAHTGGNKAEAARLLNIGIATLYRKLEGYQEN